MKQTGAGVEHHYIFAPSKKIITAHQYFVSDEVIDKSAVFR